VTGGPTLSTQGGTQALQRSEVVAVTVEGREGFVRRPNLVGALVVKAAAHTNVGEQDPRRHRRDFLVLAGLVTASDFAGEELSKKDRELLLEVRGAIDSITRIRLAAELG
jgi:hypothetical protein